MGQEVGSPTEEDREEEVGDVRSDSRGNVGRVGPDRR